MSLRIIEAPKVLPVLQLFTSYAQSPVLPTTGGTRLQSGMDSGQNPRPKRGAGWDRVALALQGGGALGAYQAGVFEELAAASLEPDWVAGVSIGAINGAIIAGNKAERRLARLREFWQIVTEQSILPQFWQPHSHPGPIQTAAGKVMAALSYGTTLAFGVPRFFRPYVPGPNFVPPGTPGATSYYDTAPLRELLESLVDFDQLNSGEVRYSAGSVRIDTGNYVFFDTLHTTIEPEHVMASGALPPGLPMIEIAGKQFWDGGVVSNTPLQHLLDNIGDARTLVFQVDLFSARGPVPRDMFEVMNRQKDIQYSSRTRLVTDTYDRMRRQDEKLRRALDRIPDDALDPAERAEKARLASMPEISILQLIYQQAAYEGSTKDADFSPAARQRHWAAGQADTRQTLSHKEWLQLPTGRGLALHDVHRDA
jgi:NTE family protein